MKKFIPIIISVLNPLIWFVIYLNDLYNFEMYLAIGGGVVAIIGLILTTLIKDALLRKTCFALSGLFLLLYIAFWVYVYLLAKGYSEYPH